MAKTKANKSTGTRSDVIREVLKAQPKASVKDIQAVLKERGVTASDALVNKLKYLKPKGSRKGKRGRSASGVNKAEAIRNMLDEMGRESRPRDVIAALAGRGIEVTSAQVSTLRNRLPHARNGRSEVMSLEHLLAAKQLVLRVGSIENARQAIASLAKIMEK